MKKIYFTFAISCLIMQSNIHSDTGADLFGDIHHGSTEIVQPPTDEAQVETSEEEIVPTEVDNSDDSVDSKKDSETTEDEIQIPNSIVAKNITPKDFLKKSNIEEVGKILKALQALSTESDDNDSLSDNIQNLTKTLKNLKNQSSLKEKMVWELTVKQMIYARTAGLNDGQSETGDVNIVKAFLEQLYQLDSSYKITSEIQKRTNNYVVQSMKQCKQDTLQSEIVPSYQSMIDSKKLNDFEHWGKVAIDRWGNDMYSCYRGAFESAATVQVYLQVIKPELKLIQQIFTLIDSLDRDLFFSLSRIEVPAATEESFKEETNLSLTAIIEAYNSDKRGLDLFLFEQLQSEVKDEEKLSETLETLEASFLALKGNPSVSGLLSGQTDLRATKIELVQTTLPDLSYELDEKIQEIGQKVELSSDSVFEKKDGRIFLKKSFSMKIKDAKDAKEVNDLLEQVKAEKHQLIASALKSRYTSALANGASDADITRYRDEMNQFLGKKYEEQFSSSAESSGALPSTLETPFTGKIFNIQTSLRLLNAESTQIGSMYNNDKITIIGIRWGEDKAPIAYQIKTKKARLKASFKSEESGYVSAEYVKLDNQEDLDSLIASASDEPDTTEDNTQADSNDSTSVDPNLNYTKFEAIPGQIVNISTSLRVKDRDSNQIASMYSNEKVMIIGIHWKENSSEALAYLIDLSSDRYKTRLKQGAKEEGFVSVEYCEFTDPSQLPKLKNMRDAKNQLREDLKAQGVELAAKAKQLEARKETLNNLLTGLDEAVVNIKDYLDIEDNITRNKVLPNEKFVKLLKELHEFSTNEPDQEDNDPKLQVTEQILSFFENDDIANSPKVLNYYFMSAILKEFQTKIDALQSVTKEYLDNIQ